MFNPEARLRGSIPLPALRRPLGEPPRTDTTDANLFKDTDFEGAEGAGSGPPRSAASQTHPLLASTPWSNAEP